MFSRAWARVLRRVQWRRRATGLPSRRKPRSRRPSTSPLRASAPPPPGFFGGGGGRGGGGGAGPPARHYGCRVTTTTLSREQHRWATERMARAGLQDRVEVLLCDYRDLRGEYDRRAAYSASAPQPVPISSR